MTGDGKRRLFCWSGGGMPGLDIHAGYWLALEEAGIVSSANIGTSAGAIAGSMNSAGASATWFAQLIRSLADRDVRLPRFAWKLRAFWIDSWLRNEPIAELLNLNLPPTFEQLQKPLMAVCTQYPNRAEYVNPGRNPRAAVLASMSICGVFPPVEIEGKLYVDGGVRETLPIPPNWQEWDEIWLLVATRDDQEYEARKGIIGNLLWNVNALLFDQIADALQMAATINRGVGPRVRVLWDTDLRAPKGTLHFDHGLICRAYEYAAKEIAGVRS